MNKYMVGSLPLAAALLLAVPPLVQAQSPEAAAVVTELRLNRGEAQVRLPGHSAPQKAAPLQSLPAGARIVASRDASVVVLFPRAMRTVTVDRSNSPFEIEPPGDREGPSASVLTKVANLLLGKKKPPAYVPLSVRGGKHPPTLLSPRETKLLTEAPTFQWMGMDMQPGTLRVYGPQGLQWSAENIARTRLRYPPSAPRLRPGVEYSWSIQKEGFPVRRARFTILTPAEAAPIRERLTLLDEAGGVSRNTRAILKANYLLSLELYYESREILASAVRADPDEPTVHRLLGEVYEKTGLRKLARKEYEEAQFLLKVPQ